LSGIVAFGASPIIEGNVILNSSVFTLRLEDVRNASISLNDLDGGQAAIYNSSLDKLQVQNGTLYLVNSSWKELEIGRGGVAEVKWWVQLEIFSKVGKPIEGANVRILDSQKNEISELQSDQDGLIPLVALTQKKVSENGTVDLNPYYLEVEVEGVMQRFELTVDSNRLYSLNFRPPVEEQHWLWYAMIVLALISLCFAPSMAIERSRYAVLALLMIFYVKLKKEDVLEQFTRGRIYGYIEANPGEHFGAIRKALSLSNGNAVYHLQVLETQGRVVSKNDGMYKRFYPKGVAVPPDDGFRLREIHQRILSCIGEAPGVSQKELANLLGLHQSTLEYQLRKLVKAGLIRQERSGRRVRYHSARSDK
ncbi:MAG: winged helix-turn-helix transcriptional regulator, partial [Thermoplasmata archaeon]|nr:winged helix-turn-helix transcriptional regulator [Thermoplasmata archaeon]